MRFLGYFWGFWGPCVQDVKTPENPKNGDFVQTIEVLRNNLKKQGVRLSHIPGKTPQVIPSVFDIERFYGPQTSDFRVFRVWAGTVESPSRRLKPPSRRYGSGVRFLADFRVFGGFRSFSRNSPFLPNSGESRPIPEVQVPSLDPGSGGLVGEGRVRNGHPPQEPPSLAVWVPNPTVGDGLAPPNRARLHRWAVIPRRRDRVGVIATARLLL